jgi:hypothetical protein
LTRLYGRGLSGYILDDLTPKDLWSVVLMHYREVVRTRQPLFARSASPTIDGTMK